MFVRAQLSAQLATICDFILTILLTSLFHLYYVYATFAGAVLGGMVNCIINYRWTFKTPECKKKHVALKYILVWIGSLFLNTWGTYLLTELMMKVNFVHTFSGWIAENLFILSKVVMSVLVAVCWNYLLHRNFVYKDLNIKDYFKENLINKNQK